jgi:hypothetical protein
MVLVYGRRKKENNESAKKEIAYDKDDPHDDCTHWIGVI